MEWLVPVLAVGALLGLLTALVRRPLRRMFGEIQAGRAREAFRLQHERLAKQFHEAAAASGKPRGLRWKHCEFEHYVELVRDKQTRQLVGLVAVTIAFEAVEGGDMEGLPAVGNLRQATAVFFFTRGQWHTAGRAVFNMDPDELLKNFKDQYELVEHHVHY
jgi:hypothetical protein